MQEDNYYAPFEEEWVYCFAYVTVTLKLRGAIHVLQTFLVVTLLLTIAS